MQVDYNFTTLAAAEEALQQAAFSIGAVKLETIKIVGRIREHGLYTQYIDPQSGKECKSLDDYLRAKNDYLQRVSGMGGRTVTRRLKSYLVFCDALDFPDDWFLDMGEHLVVLSELANTDRDLELQQEDRPSPFGGAYLGASALREEALSVTQAVQGGGWKVKDTRLLVEEKLGKKASTSKPEWAAECHVVFGTEEDPDAERVRIDRLVWLCDGRLLEFELKDSVGHDDLRYFAAKSHVRIDGLGESYADAHLH